MAYVKKDKPTIAGMARAVGQSRQAMYHLKKHNLQKFNLLWNGYCESIKKKG